MKITRLRNKIILAVSLCILFIGIFSYTFLYTHLRQIISDKAERTEQFTLETVQRRIDEDLASLFMLGMTQAGDVRVVRAMQYAGTDTVDARSDMLSAYSAMSTALSGSNMQGYVDKFMVFNEHGTLVQAVNSTTSKNTLWDADRVRGLALFEELETSDAGYLMAVSPSIIDGETPCVALISYVNSYSNGRATARGWLYVELNTRYFEDTLLPYTENGIFVAEETKPVALLAGGQILPEGIVDSVSEANDLEELSYGGQLYRVLHLPLTYGGLQLYSCANITFYAADYQQMLATVLVVAVTTVAIVILLAMLLATQVTRPLEKLTARLRRISDNDLSYDAEIEKGSDEIAEVGRVVNEMTMSIDNLMHTTENMYRQRQDIEIALLQSQVNPHFLYNTLDSIHWMAIIQDNPGIAKTVRSLSNLLKNLAKGTGDKIPLSEELSLLQDYTDTQQVRFMGLFDIEIDIPEELLDCRIVKFTLQPLVENALFHGIEPLGRCGTVRISGEEDGEYLLLYVEDDGVGMDEEALQRLMTDSQNPHPKGMASIGVANVNSRLKLVYGEECGLQYESEKGRYTRAILRIRKEKEDV